MKPLYFFSYSRQELYFAEAAVLGLQKAGLNIWFDLQQLEPGCEWSSEIQRGLDTCDGLIVLASYASLHSLWVALEWKHALEAGKPIHIILFEAVIFDPIPSSDKTNNQPIALDELQKAAVSIIDMRRQFNEKIARLVPLINEQKSEHDAIPAPNRWRLPTVMPLAVAGVTFSLMCLTAFLLWASLWGFSIYWPMMLAGLVIAVWSGDRTIAFLRRRSFREARVILPLAMLISPFLVIWLTPIFALGTLLIFRSQDILRWSPLGQGIDRARAQEPIPQNFTSPHNWLERIAHAYVSRLRWGRWWVLAVTILGNGLLLSSAQSVWMLIFPLLTITLILFERVDRRLTRPVPSGVTYRLVAAPQDMRVGRQVDKAMAHAGHEHLPEDAEGKPNFVIVILSNNTSDATLQTYAATDAKLICIAASALDDWARYKPLARFQWVDYRRQQSERLAAMALDILHIGGDGVGYSFSTHQTPQGFEKLLMPGKVLTAIGLTYISVIQMVWGLMQILLMDRLTLPIAFVLFEIVVFVPIYIWLIIRITRREITIWLTMLLGLVTSLLTLALGVQTNVPGLKDTFAISSTLLIGVSLLITYPLYRIWLGTWLPPHTSRRWPVLLPRRDWPQWRFYLLTIGVTALLALAFLRVDYARTPPSDTVRSVTHEKQLTLDVPAYWVPANTEAEVAQRRQTVMLAEGLGRVSLTFGPSLADTLNSLMIGSSIAPTVTASFPIQWLDTGALGWRLVEDSRYVPDASQSRRSLRVMLWAYPHGFLYKEQARSVLALLEGSTTFQSAGAVTETAVTDTITRFEERFTAQGQSNDGLPISLVYDMIIFDTPDTAFFLSIAGDPDTMVAETAAIQKTIASAQFDVTPQMVEGTVDHLRFDMPHIWDTITTLDVKDPSTWTGSLSQEIALQYIPQVQSSYDATGLPIHVVCGANVNDDMGHGMFMNIARYDDATSDDLLSFMQIVVQQSQQTLGVEVVDDSAELLRDALGVEIVKLNVSGNTLWYVGMIVDGQVYLVQIVADTTVMSGYTDVLKGWLASFKVVP